MSGKSHYKPATDDKLKKYAHYLSSGERMIYFTGLASTYLLRKFCLRFIFPGVPVIIVTVIGGLIAKVGLVQALLGGYLFAAIIAGVMVYVEAIGTQYILTNRRLIMQLGLFNVSLTSAVYDKITHVDVRQSFIERSLYHFGKVIIHTAGSQKKAIVLKNIAHPIHFKNILEDLIDTSSNHHEETSTHAPKWKQAKRGERKRLVMPI